LPPLAELKALTELNMQLELGGASAVPALPAPDFDTEAAAEDMDSEGDPLTDGPEVAGRFAAADGSSDA
jgi:hypothetical protein